MRHAAAWRLRNPSAPASRGGDDPVAVERQRRYAGEAAAARRVVCAGRPAHHTGDDAAAVLILERGRAGVSGAGAHASAFILGLRIDQAHLQCAGLAGDGERRRADGADAAIAAGDRRSDADDSEARHRRKRNARHAEKRGRLAGHRRGQAQQRDIRCCPMRGDGLRVVARMHRDLLRRDQRRRLR